MKNLLLIVLLCTGIGMRAQNSMQSAMNVTGGSFQQGYYQFEWSVGETALVDMMEEPSRKWVLTNGFLQPYLLYPANNNQSHWFESNEIRIFPNPSTEYVELNLNTKHSGSLSLQLYSATGQIVFNKDMQLFGVDLVERIPLTTLCAGVYLLQIDLHAVEGSVSKKSTYKIVKIR